jgi:hypothetical protein
MFNPTKMKHLRCQVSGLNSRHTTSYRFKQAKADKDQRRLILAFTRVHKAEGCRGAERRKGDFVQLDR